MDCKEKAKRKVKLGYDIPKRDGGRSGIIR